MVALGAESGSFWCQRWKCGIAKSHVDSMVPYYINMFRYRLLINQRNMERKTMILIFKLHYSGSKNALSQNQGEFPELLSYSWLHHTLACVWVWSFWRYHNRNVATRKTIKAWNQTQDSSEEPHGTYKLPYKSKKLHGTVPRMQAKQSGRTGFCLTWTSSVALVSKVL